MRVVLDEGAILPTKAHDTDAGFDLYAREDFVVPPCKMKLFSFGSMDYMPPEVSVGSAVHDVGVHVELPPNTVGMLKSKSGLNVKHSITSEGVIDVGYTGSIVVKLYNHSSSPYRVSKGDKISQLVIMPIKSIKNSDLKVVESLSDTDRGNNGFGSSGK